MWWMLLAAPAQAESHVWARSIQRLELHNAAGDLHLERGGERIEVRLVRVLDEGCDIVVGERTDRAEVWIRDPSRSGNRCRINVAVRLPLQSRAQLSVGIGDLHAVGLDASVAASIGTGHVRLEGSRGLRLNLGAGRVSGWSTGDVSLHVGAGDIALTGLRAPLTAEVGTGDIRLRFDEAPVGTVRAHTGQGDVWIDLPDQACPPLPPTVLETHAGLGDVHVN